MVAQATKLSKLYIKTIFSSILGREPPPESEPVENFDLVFLSLADLLNQLRFLQHEQRIYLLQEITPALPRLSEDLLQIVFADGKFCTWTGKTGFVDLSAGADVDPIPAAPVETIGYNLNELVRRNILKIEHRNGFHVETNAAGSVEESEDFCVNYTDAVSGPVRDGGNELGSGHNHAGS